MPGARFKIRKQPATPPVPRAPGGTGRVCVPVHTCVCCVHVCMHVRVCACALPSHTVVPTCPGTARSTSEDTTRPRMVEWVTPPVPVDPGNARDQGPATLVVCPRRASPNRPKCPREQPYSYPSMQARHMPHGHGHAHTDTGPHVFPGHVTPRRGRRLLSPTCWVWTSTSRGQPG